MALLFQPGHSVDEGSAHAAGFCRIWLRDYEQHLQSSRQHSREEQQPYSRCSDSRHCLFFPYLLQELLLVPTLTRACPPPRRDTNACPRTREEAKPGQLRPCPPHHALPADARGNPPACAPKIEPAGGYACRPRHHAQRGNAALCLLIVSVPAPPAINTKHTPVQRVACLL
jgi:hypothetical protein